MTLDQKDRGAALTHEHPFQKHLGPLPERRLQIGLVVPERHDAPAVVAHQRFQHVDPAAGRLPGRAGQHSAAQGHLGAETQARHLDQA